MRTHQDGVDLPEGADHGCVVVLCARVLGPGEGEQQRRLQARQAPPGETRPGHALQIHKRC